MEFKHFAFTELKADADARTVEGWASTFGNVDSDNDIIAPGAFMESLKGRMPKMLWQHNSGQPIGVWTQAQETAQWLYVKGVISKTQLGNDVYQLAQDGAIDSMSIGFAIEKYSLDATTGTRTIQQCDLWEVSLVTFPANEMAKITGVKGKPETERDLEKYLRDAGFSRSDAKKIVAGGYKALTDQRDVDCDQLATSLQHAISILKG